MAWPRKEHVGQPQVPIQLPPRPHRELQRMSDNPRTQIQPAMTAPHMPMQARLVAQRFRAQRDAHLQADNLRHARAARRTRPDNNFLTYDTSRGGNSRHGYRAVWTTIPDANQITKGQPAPWRRNGSGNPADVWHGRYSLSQTIRSHLQATNHAMAVQVSQHVPLPLHWG